MFESSRTASIMATTMGKQQRMEDAAGMGDLFDHIDDLLDFDDEAEDALLMVEPCVDKTGAFLLPPLSPPLPPPQPVAAAATAATAAGAGEESLECSSNQKPCDVLDIVELEWAPKFLDDSVNSFFLDDIDIPISDAIADNVDGEMPQAKAEACFRTSSPVSVLEANTKCSGNGDSSSSSSSSTSASYLGSPPEPPSAAPTIPARARSKRRRPATFSPGPIITVPIAATTSDPESSGESFPAPPSPPSPPKKRKISTKKSPAAAEEEDDDEWGSPPGTARKCMHCGIQKTPQWRAGPIGPKTLCNACGVRYKSGRLFPEYRPAASPTFVPSLHSNSHKKVVEMRNRGTAGGGGGSMPSSDGCDLLEYIRRRH